MLHVGAPPREAQAQPAQERLLLHTSGMDRKYMILARLRTPKCVR